VHDPRIDPAAFALVGMGTFYGGLAHVPLSALILVCELAGSYDLLVPMMLSVSVAFVALRDWTLYRAQPATRAQSPAFREEAVRLATAAAMRGVRAAEALVPAEVPAVEERTPRDALRTLAARADRQAVLVVVGADGAPRGLVDLRALEGTAVPELDWILAADLMVPYAAVEPGDSLAAVDELLRERGLPQVPVAQDGVLHGFVGDDEIARAGGRVLLRA
jgi:CIC family chloride channel protein